MTQTENDHSVAPSSNDELIHSIGRLAAEAGLSAPSVLKTLRADLHAAAHPRRALTNFHRFLMTGFATAWLRDFHEHHLLQQILLDLCSQSQFLADILVRNPELFRWLTSSNVLNVTKTDREYHVESLASTEVFHRLEKKLDALKRFQRRELLRVGARQILREADVATTSGELSSLADSIIESLLRLAYDQLSVQGEGAAEKELAVIGLGKLGGAELNFSSDIDLLFVYEHEGPNTSPAGRMSTLNEHYSKIAEFVVRRLSEYTGEGHFYRVDMRLRPDGFSGPLAMSRAAYRAYYEARGELWERQMLIKARVIAGDWSVGEKWMLDIQPFVFPKTLLASPLEEIARIKSRIESSVDGEANIKLGVGGIRDIEFAVQALQLLNGGANCELRNRNTVLALEKLAASGLLKEREASDLRSAYFFLRLVEDRLQLLHGLQKHSLPESPEERAILAKQLGYESSPAFVQALGIHQSRIRAIFSSVFGIEKQGSKRVVAHGPETLSDSVLARRWGFIGPVAARANLSRILRELPDLKTQARARLLLDLARKFGAPDWCLNNFSLLASSVPIRRTLQQALANDRVLELLILLCSRSSKYTTLLSREPLLFESLIGRPEDLLEQGQDWSFLRQSDLLRFRFYNEFAAVLRFISGVISILRLTEELSRTADIIASDTFNRAREDAGHGKDIPFAVIAFGKYGGTERSIGSDLDLILFYRGKGMTEAKLAESVGRRFRENISSVYDLDLRLRPEGKNAPLATEIDYYKGYLERRASLWERQSLVKARFVCGDAVVGQEITECIAAFAYRAPLPRNWTKELDDMRQRIARERTGGKERQDLKTGIGGLVDLEFLVQALQLRFGSQYPKLIQANTFTVVPYLRGRAMFDKSEVRRVSRNLSFLRRLETTVRMNSEVTDFVLPTDRIQLQAASAGMEMRQSKELGAAIRSVLSENQKFYQKALRLAAR